MLSVKITVIPIPPPTSAFPCFSSVFVSLNIVVLSYKSTTYALEPMPSSFLKIVFDCFSAELLHVINLSYFSVAFKTAFVEKAFYVDATKMSNFRPSSNLMFLSKVLEKKWVYSPC